MGGFRSADFRMSEMQTEYVEDLHKGQDRCVFFVKRCERDCEMQKLWTKNCVFGRENWKGE